MNEILTDDQLVQLFAAGDPNAFEELVLRYKNSLYQYLLSLLKDEGSAGDLFQEVFMALFKHAADFKAQGKLKAWLFLTARNKAFNYLRDQKGVDSLDQPDEEGNEFLHETLPDGEKDQLAQLTSQEGLEKLKNAIDQLPPRQKEVIYLRQYLSFAEMAEVQHRPLGTVLADCHRAVAKVRMLLAEEEL